MKRDSIFLLLILSFLSINAQIEIPKLTSPAPPSPNAAALGKFGEIPVTLSNGIPDISIPLYEIKAGQITVPISLNYHAGGIKVEETASWVGLGWALNAGGVITRVTRGIPDEGGGGFRYNGNKVNQFIAGSMSTTEMNQYIQNVEAGNIDAEPDIFYYNINGYSGKFFFTNDGELFTITRSNIKISFLPDGSGWEIISPEGTKYVFNQAERTVSTPFSRTNGGAVSDGNPTDIVTSWFLKEITDVYGNTTRFVYTDINYYFRTKAVESMSIKTAASPGFGGLCEDQTWTSTYYENEIWGKRLRQIIFPNGKVEFIASSQGRLDLPFPYDNALEKIQIKSGENIIKEYKLTTGYFENTDATKRLRLEAVTEIAGSANGGKYSFEYNPLQLPGVLSNDQDNWGYYNAANNTQYFVPFEYSNGVHGGADREVNIDASQADILQKINYPAGGYTKFEFENNSLQQYTPESHLWTSYFSLNGNNSLADDPDVYYETPFILSEGDLNGQPTLTTRLLVTRYSSNPSVLSDIIIRMLYPDGTMHYVNENEMLELGAGKYMVYAQISTEFARNPYCYFYLDLQKQITIPGYYSNKWVGGLRVKKIINQAQSTGTEEIKTFKYNRFNEIYSSGTVGNMPDFGFDLTYHREGDPGGALFQYECHYKKYNSSSNYPLITTSGSFVTYANVTTELGENAANGKVESTFTSNESPYLDEVFTNFPFPPNTSFEWKRGLLRMQTIYRKDSNDFKKVSEEENEYIFRDAPGDILRKESIGVKMGRDEFYMKQPILPGLQIIHYNTVTGFFGLEAKISRTYNSADASKFIETRTTYQYSDSHFQPVQITTSNSKNEEIIIYKKYPSDDMPDLPAVFADAKRDLVSKNVLSAVLEQSITVNGVETEKARTNYKIVTALTSAGSMVPVNAPATIEVKKGAGNPLRTEIEYLGYLSNGNITLQRKKYDYNNVYIWDYNQSYPVAEIKNADEDRVAYTSFEADGKGNWSGIDFTKIISAGGVTGSKYYFQNNLSFSVSGLDALNTYTVSYWSRNGAYSIAGTQPGYPKAIQTLNISGLNWTLYEHLVTGQNVITISGSGAIDELRLHPKDALMTTYTYAPLVGMTSLCDAAGHISFFQYDAFGRLEVIKDQNQNVLKKYEYKYASQ